MLYRTQAGKEAGYTRAMGTVRTEEDRMIYNKMINMGKKRVHIKEGLLYYNRHIHNYNQ